ncbi:MAG TPA: DNA mismatch repair endonuclease MutL [Verrucomicrobiota bacterium]|nr:DNA mismatch repair endonuclease MutL [Verrucomicrobiota bacterium]
MNRIKLLPEHVANQIAAGEVVERPASVVKELVENALDAQAARITVEVQAGGRSLVRVTDDGIGMNRDDALLCLERHATSKIRKAEDLSSIATMGFRGEALPSIASVSRFTLTTRERDSDTPEGTQVIINGGKMTEVKAAGAATGTSVEVRQLFFNLPARRKFLRTEETEAAHIQHYLTLAALAHPQVAFTYQKDGRIVWQLRKLSEKPDDDAAGRIAALRERFRALMGDVKLMDVDFSAPFEIETSEPDASFEQSSILHSPSALRLWGLAGAPGVSRATREDQHVFVNRRPVENRGINFALMEGYHTALMKGRYPVCCLFLEIDPSAVDVNIHPAKREVKFHREAEVRRLVAQAVRETLLKFHSRDEQNRNIQRPTPNMQRPTLSTVRVISPGAMERTSATLELPNFTPPSQQRPAMLPTKPEQPPLNMGFASTPVQSPVAQPPSAPVPLLSVPMRLVGVIGRLYVVLESDRGLVLLDQHAAHERILFEQMVQRLEQKETAPSQKLLLPETIELSVRDAQFLREQLSDLTRLGVGLNEFGERTFLLDALPPFVKVSDARKFVIDLVDELKSAGKEINSSRLGEHTVAKTVCRHAVKANDPLAGRELENLVEDLRRCSMPYTCPHGRPTLIEMNYRELEKKFGRTQ